MHVGPSELFKICNTFKSGEVEMKNKDRCHKHTLAISLSLFPMISNSGSGDHLIFMKALNIPQQQ
jgi:hypothetical protein